MNELEELTKSVGIDWTKVNIIEDAGSTLRVKFGISPDQYLEFAYQDFESNDIHGYVNAISNAKRSSECQLDGFFACIGYTTWNEKFLPQNEKDYINKHSDAVKKKIPAKLKLLNALDVAPLILITKMRSLRNNVEHQYEIPNRNETVEALEIAQYFNAMIQNVLKGFCEQFFIENDFEPKRKLRFAFDAEKHHFDIYGFVEGKDIGNIRVLKGQYNYLELIKLNIAIAKERKRNVNEALYELLQSINCKIPRNKVEVNLK